MKYHHTTICLNSYPGIADSTIESFFIVFFNHLGFAYFFIKFYVIKQRLEKGIQVTITQPAQYMLTQHLRMKTIRDSGK